MLPWILVIPWIPGSPGYQDFRNSYDVSYPRIPGSTRFSGFMGFPRFLRFAGSQDCRDPGISTLLPGVPGHARKEFKLTVRPGRKKCYRQVLPGKKEFEKTMPPCKKENQKASEEMNFKGPIGSLEPGASARALRCRQPSMHSPTLPKAGADSKKRI